MNNDEFNLNLQRQNNIGLNQTLTAKIENQTILKDQLAIAQAGSKGMRKQDQETINALQNGIDNAARERDFYKNLLSKPMAEIAQHNNEFKATLIIQQQLLANWMVSQRAFKELAIDFGIQLGKTKEEVVKEGISNKEKVLNNKAKHGNNASDDKFIESYSESLKSKIINK